MALAARDVEIDAADDLGAAEALAHIAQRDGDVAHSIAPFALASAINASQRARNPRASRPSHAPPPISAAAPSSQGKAVAGSTAWKPIFNALPSATPILANDPSPSRRPKPTTPPPPRPRRPGYVTTP